MITKRAQPDKAFRGRQFEAGLARLASWWAESFRVHHNKGIRHQSYEEASESIGDKLASAKRSNDGKGKGKACDSSEGDDDAYDFGQDSERVRSEKSLMKHAIMMCGSPDMSAQLFTSLCRGLGLPARLVSSIQSVLWRREKSDKTKVTEKALQKSRKKLKDQTVLRRDAALVAAVARNAAGSRSSSASTPTGSKAPVMLVDTAQRDNTDAAGGMEDFVAVDLRTQKPAIPSLVRDPSPKLDEPVIRLRRSRPKGNVLGPSPGAS
jgi:xeroderma pigmentosum group C-complementing protein